MNFPGAKKFYLGAIHNAGGTATAGIWRYDNGSWSTLVTAAATQTSGPLRFDVQGSLLRFFVNDVIQVSAVDSTYQIGRNGLRLADTISAFDDFEATSLVSARWDDEFNRISLGPGYDLAVGQMQIQNNRVQVTTTVNSYALTTVTQSYLTDVSVEAAVTVTGSGTQQAGLFARYTGPADNNFYLGTLVSRATGLAAEIWKNVSGTWTLLTTQTVSQSSAILRFEVLGTSLKLYLDNVLVTSAVDSSITGPGLAGMRGTFDETFDSLHVIPLPLKTENTLVFYAQTTSRTIVVPVIGDRNGEQDESFFVRLSNPVNATISGSDTAEGRILDDDSGISFQQTTVSALESEPTVSTTVSISPAAKVAGEFFAEVIGGTAIEGVDFEPHRGHFFVSQGMTSIPVELIHPIDDTADEPDKTVILRLVRVDGVGVRTPNTITVTIQDNDAAPPPANPAGPAVITPDNLRTDQSQAAGTLAISHVLPSYQANMAPLVLSYNSAAAEPQPVFLVRYTVGATVPATVKAKLTFNGVAGQEFFYDTAARATGDVLQIALQADATALASGRYSYQIDVTPSGGPTTTYTGQATVVNGQGSEFGEGWSLEGLHRIRQATGGVILETARGLSLWFADAGPGTFTSPAGDFSTLVLSGGVYTRTLKDGVKIHFDSTGRQTSVVDRNNNNTTFGYNATGLASITDPNGLITNFGYTDTKVTSITDPANRVTVLNQASGRLTFIDDIDPDGGGALASPRTSFEYDGVGRMTSRTDPRSNATNFAYNFAAQLTTVTWPDETPDPNPQEQFKPVQFFGLVDPASGQGTQSNPAPSVLASAALAEYTDPRNIINVWKTELDNLGFGLPVRMTNPLSETTTIGRNMQGLPIYISDGLGQTTNYGNYDAKGNPQLVTLPDGAQYQYLYNGFSQVTQITEPDPDGTGSRLASVTGFEYDANGNLLKHKLPDEDGLGDNNPFEEFGYHTNGKGWLISAKDAQGFVTSFAHDTRGRVTNITYPDNDSDSGNPLPNVVMGYDNAGNLLTYQDENAKVTTFGYDNLGRQLTVTLPDDSPDPNPVVTYVYDAASNVTSMTNPLGHATTMLYDAMNRLKQVTTPDPDGAGAQVAATMFYAYDLAGNQTSVTDPVGRQNLFTYDQAGRMTEARQGANFNVNYEYDAANRLFATVGPAPDRNFPSADRLRTEYAYDGRGQVISVSDNYDPVGISFGRQRTYDYNPAGELVGFT